MSYDILAMRRDGFSDEEIFNALRSAPDVAFDLGKMRKDGHSASDILNALATEAKSASVPDSAPSPLDVALKPYMPEGMKAVPSPRAQVIPTPTMDLLAGRNRVEEARREAMAQGVPLAVIPGQATAYLKGSGRKGDEAVLAAGDAAAQAERRAIEAERTAAAARTQAQIDKQEADALAARGPVPDNAWEYSIDTAQELFGEGVSALGGALGLKGIQGAGGRMVETQKKDIRIGGYRVDPTTVRRAFERGGFTDAVGVVGTRIAENWASTGAVMGMSVAAAVTAPFSATAATVIGGGTLVAGALLGAGEIKKEFKEKGVEGDDRTAVGVGIIVGLLDRFGAGKVIPKDILTHATGNEIVTRLITAGKVDAAKAFSKEILKRTSYETGTELAQEVLIVGAGATHGAKYTTKQLVDRAIDTAAVSIGQGGTISTATTTLEVAAAPRDPAHILAAEIDRQTFANVTPDFVRTQHARETANIIGTPLPTLSGHALISTAPRAPEEPPEDPLAAQPTTVPQMPPAVSLDPVNQVFDPNVTVDQQLQAVDAAVNDTATDVFSVIDQSIASLQDADMLDIPDVGQVRVRKSATDLRMELADGTRLDDVTIGRLLSDPKSFTIMERGGKVTEGGANVLQQRADLRDAEMAAAGDAGQGAGLLGSLGVSGTAPVSPGATFGGDTARVIPGIGETRPIRTVGAVDQALIDVERVAREGWAATDAAAELAAAEAAAIMGKSKAATAGPAVAPMQTDTSAAPAVAPMQTDTNVLPPVAVGTSAAGNVVLTPPVGTEFFTPDQVDAIRTNFGGGVATGPADARVSVTLPKPVTLEQVNNAIQEQATAESLLGAEEVQPQVEVGLPEVAVGGTQGPAVGGIQASPERNLIVYGASQVPTDQTYLTNYIQALSESSDKESRDAGSQLTGTTIISPETLPVPGDARAEAAGQLTQQDYVVLAEGMAALAGPEARTVLFHNPKVPSAFVIRGEGGRVFINTATPRAAGVALGEQGHEVTHIALAWGLASPNAGVRRVAQLALDVVAKGLDRKGYAAYYGIAVSDLVEEAAADVGGNLHLDPAFYAEVFRRAAHEMGKSAGRKAVESWAKEFVNSINKVIAYIGRKTVRGFDVDRYLNNAKDAKLVVKEALIQYYIQNGIPNSEAALKARQVTGVKAEAGVEVTAPGTMLASPRRTNFGMLSANSRMALSPDPLLALPAAVPVEAKLGDVNARLDTITEAYPNVLTSPQMWFRFMSDITGIGSAFMAPSRAIDWQKSPNDARNFVHRMTRGQRESSAEGLATTRKIGQAFAEGDLGAEGLTKILVWGALSKQLTAAAQEAGFLRMFSRGLDSYVQKAASGQWTAEDTASGLEWIDTLFQAGQRGMPAQAKANANSVFTTTFPALTRAKVDGKPLIDHIAESIANGVPSQQIRRDFILHAGSSGIRNKVFSFALLAAGRNDVVVIDRWQARNFWSGAQTVDHAPVKYHLINAKGQRVEKSASYLDSIYDGLPKGEGPKGTTFGGINEYIDGPQGLAIYEAIERSLAATANEIYHGESGVGRLHWESWLVINQQEVGHSSLEAILKNDPEYAPVAEGRKTVYTEGDIYVIEDQQEVYYVPTGQGTFARYTAVEYAQLPQDRAERASQATARLVSDGAPRSFTYGLDTHREVPAGAAPRGVSIEVAPDPRDQAAVEVFNAMSEQDRLEVTRETADPIIRDLMLRLAIRDYSVEYTLGGFEGGTQPSVDLHFGEGVSYAQITEAAKILGTLWRQQVVITYDESNTSEGGGQFVKVVPDRTLSYDETHNLFKQVYARFPAAAGFTARGGALVFGNFTDGAVSSNDFLSGLRAALADVEVKTHTHYETVEKFFRSDWIEPVNLEGTRYESDSVTQGTAPGRDMLRGRQGNFDTLQARSDKTFRRAVERRRALPRFSPARGGSDAGRGGHYREGAGREVRPVYGTERSQQHSLSVVGVSVAGTEVSPVWKRLCYERVRWIN